MTADEESAMGNGQATLILHGLDEDNRLVRADVFAKKVSSFVKGLVHADKLANHKRAHVIMITHLDEGSARIQIREKVARRAIMPASSINRYREAISCIYNGNKSSEQLPGNLIDAVEKLSSGSGSVFSHGELSFGDDNVIRIDDYLFRQARAAKCRDQRDRPRFYSGLSNGSFDGVLKVMDARGQVLRAKLILTAGGAEIDCAVNKGRVPEVRQLLDERVRVEGLAHYGGSQPLPARVDIESIKLVRKNADLLRWRGKLCGEGDSADWLE